MLKRVRNGSVTNRYAGVRNADSLQKRLINKAIIDIRLPGVMNRYAKKKLYRYALRTP
jgi:hypothetical protein